MDLVSPAEYARHAGITKTAVGQQIASGRIPAYGPAGERLEPGTKGKKFVSPAEADPARGRTRTRVNVDDDAQDEPTAPRGAPPTGEHGQPNLTRARTASEAHRAQLLRLDLEERRGKLMRVSKVEDAIASAGEKIVRIINQLPMDADDLTTAVARGGIPALRLAMKEIARRMRTGIADALSLDDV
jgi:peptide subunit release factor 1 (eRF1)